MTDDGAGPSAVDGNDARGVPFWCALVLGLGVMTYGIVGLVADARATRPLEAAKWLVGADLLHDLVLVPLVAAIGWLVGRIVPRPVRWPVRAGLVGTALVVAIGWIPLRGYGRLPDNRSLAPLDYGVAIAVVVAGVWCACGLWAAITTVGARLGARRRGPSRG